MAKNKGALDSSFKDHLKSIDEGATKLFQLTPAFKSLESINIIPPKSNSNSEVVKHKPLNSSRYADQQTIQK